MLWRIRLLGEFVLEREGREVRRFRYQKAAALLAYLALHPGRAHSREVLTELLWQDEDPEVSRNRFRVLLTSLRHQLEPPGVPAGSVLVSHGSGLLELNAGQVQTDVMMLEAALRRGDQENALALYRGELLPGFYDDWVTVERERLAALMENGREHAVPAPVRIPSPASETTSPVSLPLPLTRFFGREAEMGEIITLLDTFRLVTLIGAGGSGKTRLATEVARRVQQRFPDGVYFLPLEERFDPSQIVEVLRYALRLTGTVESGDTFSAVVQHLTGRRVLLILDNFEQLVAAGGGMLVERLLVLVPTLHCLVTSRRALLIAGEREFPVAPLPTPPDSTDLVVLAQTPSVALFLDRAVAIRPDFALTVGNASAVRAICRTLEGLPLALELAAARLRAASPAQIESGLAKRLDLLARTERWAEKDRRHSSLRLALDWSWRLLDPGLQRFFTELCVFRGGWTADATAWVTEAPDVQTALESLVSDSLVRVETQGDTTRFRMLETLREFAAEHLSEADREPLAGRHAAYFCDQMERWEAGRFHSHIHPLSRWVHIVLPEIDNLRAAIAFFRAAPDGAESEARLVGAALFLWIHLGLITEAEALLAAVEARYQEPTPIRAFLLYRGVWLAQLRGDGETGRRRAAECRELYEVGGDPIGISYGWNAVGNVAQFTGDIATARTAFETAVVFGRQAHNPDFPDTYSYVGIPAGNLGGILLMQGEFAAAHDLLTGLWERERERGVRHGSGVFRNYILATEGLGRVAEATELWREFLREAYPAGNHFGVLEALESLARFAGDAGQGERAATIRHAAASLRPETAARVSLVESPELTEAIRLALL